MTKLFKKKIIGTILTILSFSLILVGCIERNVNAHELLPQSIATMKALDSYSSDVLVTFTSESDESNKVNMHAFITYHKDPFAYSSIQEITSTNPSSDNPFDQLALSLIVKDDVIYTSNSVTGLWLEETESKVVEEVKNSGDIFQNFNENNFSDLEVLSTDKNKTSDEYGVLISQLFEYNGLKLMDVEAVVISSVVPPLMYSLQAMSIKYCNKEPIIIGPGIKTGMNTKKAAHDFMNSLLSIFRRTLIMLLLQ